MELIDKVVVVTGGAKGIGKSISKELTEEKCRVIALDIDKQEGEKLQFETDNKIEFICADISKEEEIEKVCKYIINKYKKIDILINNAAKQTENEFFKMSVKEFKDIIDTNLIGTFICSNIFGKFMGEGSKIINMLSVHYNKPRKNKYHYDASKAAIAILTQEMALDIIDKGITVNAISYGACNTPMNKEWLGNQKKVEDTKNKIPMRWIAEPKEIAGFVRTILVEFSDYTTGSIFSIDGGRSIN